jgi:AmmeMemoRadiSam system protein A
MAKVLEGKNVLVIASTDMSHFLSREKANALDAKTVSRIQSGNAGSLIAEVESGENILCGGGGVAAVLLYVQKKGYCRVETLGYADSSQTGGPRDSVVGYLAAALYVSAAGQEFSLSQEEKKELLALARSAITKYVQDREVITHYPTQNQDFLTPKGAFVTLKKSHRLRGCIGFTEPLFPLYDAVIRAAVYAAVQDPRFPPLTEAELKDLEVEISVLTPPQKLISPALIQIGKHGLIIEKGDRKGLLLPQVPVENQWSEEQFLEQVCLKAGLPSDAWKFGADLYVFEAIVFE